MASRYYPMCLTITSILYSLLISGGIFDPYDQRQELAFRYAIARVNADPEVLEGAVLHGHIEKLPADDSFHASKKGE